MEGLDTGRGRGLVQTRPPAFQEGLGLHRSIQALTGAADSLRCGGNLGVVAQRRRGAAGEGGQNQAVESHGQNQASRRKHSHRFAGMGGYHLPTSAFEFRAEESLAAQLG